MAFPRSSTMWWRGFSRAPGLLFIVLTFLANLVVWTQMDSTLESLYVLVVWILEGVCAALWTGGIVFITAKQRSKERTELLSALERQQLLDDDRRRKQLSEEVHIEVSRVFHDLRLAVYLVSTAACMIAGLTLGPWGLKLLLRDNLRPSGRIAVVMLDTTVLWMQGATELVNFIIHFCMLKFAKSVNQVQDEPRASPQNPR